MGYNPFYIIEYSIADFQRQFMSLKELLAHYIHNRDEELMQIRLLVPQSSEISTENQQQPLPDDNRSSKLEARNCIQIFSFANKIYSGIEILASKNS